MKRLFIAGGVLMAIAAGCSGGRAAAKNAELNELLAPIGTKPIAARAKSASQEPAVETADQLPDEAQARADKKKRESDAQDMLAENAAVRVDYGGIVVTLSGAALFAPTEATQLVSSQPMMRKVAGAKGREKNRRVEIVVDVKRDEAL